MRTRQLLAFFLALVTGLVPGLWMEARAGVMPVANRPVKDKWALVVGISKFENPALNLKYPAKDAQDFYNYLVTEGHFEKDHVKLLLNENATRAHILSLLGGKWLPRAAHPDDLVVIYFSSHGSPANMDVGGVNYVLAHDTDVEDLYATGIPMQDMVRIIKGRVHSDRIVILLDACHSGAASAEAKGLYVAGNVSADEVVQGTGQLVISSSEPTQVSWESKQQPNSVFTRHLISGLKLKGSSTKLADAFDYMKDKVQSEVLEERGVMQTPVLKSKWEGGDLILAVNPVSPRPAPREPQAIASAGRSSASKNIERTPSASTAAEPEAAQTVVSEPQPAPDRDIFGPLGIKKKTAAPPSDKVAWTPSATAAPTLDSEPQGVVADPARQQTWWTEFQRKEEGRGQQIASAAGEGAALSATTSGDKPPRGVPGLVKQGYFAVPSYFASQPKPYERPQEIFRGGPGSMSTTPGMNAFKATLPFVMGGGIAPFGYGYGYGWGVPAWSGAFAGAGAALSGVPGIGFGPGWGGPWGGWGWYGGPGASALYAGAFGRATNALSGMGDWSRSRVYQCAPSKASGNYYAPSTIDTSASGSYYATGTPALVPSMSPQPPVTNFWGGSQNPFGQDASMPWNK